MVFAGANALSEFGSYTLQDRIGQGHTGTLYRSLDNSDHEVAIKLLHQHVMDDTAFMETIRNSVSELKQLSHPNIVAFLDFYENDHVAALITPFLHGCTLQQYLTYYEAPGWSEVHYLARGILNGLQALHTKGRSHCNLKTSNVFLCDNGNIQLTDFMLGSADDIVTSEGLSHPELMRNDLYAFGIMLYRMATGHWPFAGEHDADDIFNASGSWIEHPLNEIKPPQQVNPGIPECLSKVIVALLHPDPDQRPDDVPTILGMFSPLGEPVRPVAPADDEGVPHYSRIPPLQEIEQRRAVHHDDEEQALDAAGIPPHSLLWVFKIASENATGGVPLDLCSPPPLEARVLTHLRESIDKVPPLPEAWHRVQGLFDDPLSSPHDVARIIGHDPVLVAHVLRLANSAAYLPSSGKPISDVSQAITRIGMEPTRNLLLQNMMPALGGNEVDSNPDMLRIWFHSQTIAAFARILASRSKSVDQRTASLYGLLHDIGKLIILRIEGADTLRKIQESIASGDSALKAEWDILGYTHIDAGMMLALHWRLPPRVHRMIYFHHHPCWHEQDTWPVDVRDQIMIVHMAHLVLQSMMGGEEMGGVWAEEQRTHVEGTEELLRYPMHFSLAEVRPYSEMQQELKRIQLMFPLLYPDSSTEEV